MTIQWNPHLKNIKKGELLGEGTYGKVYAIDKKTVIKISPLLDWQNIFYQIDSFQTLEKLQKKYDFINRTLQYFVDANYTYELQQRVNCNVYQLFEQIETSLKKQLICKTIQFVKYAQKYVCHNDLHLSNIGIKDNKFFYIDTLNIQEATGHCYGDTNLLLPNIVNVILGYPTKRVTQYMEGFNSLKRMGQKIQRLLKEDSTFVRIWNDISNIQDLTFKQQASLAIWDYDKKKYKKVSTKTYTQLFQHIYYQHFTEFEKLIGKIMDKIYK